MLPFFLVVIPTHAPGPRQGSRAFLPFYPFGRRFATYTDDIKVGSSFLTGLEASYTFDDGTVEYLKKLRISGNITNLGDVKGISTITVTGANGGFQGFPIPPRMFFVTVGAAL